MQKKKKDNHFIKQAFYEGGNTAFRKFVSENLKYPEEALTNDIEGVVHLKIEINYKGKVVSAKVMKGIGHGCDKEAQRIIKLAEYEIPSNPKKLKVKFFKNIRIQFKKPKEKKAVLPKKTTTPEESNKKPVTPIPTSNMSISYEISPAKPKKTVTKVKTQATKKAKASYSYTIKYNS